MKLGERSVVGLRFELMLKIGIECLFNVMFYNWDVRGYQKMWALS